jgi:hypothetical protein
MYSWTGTPAALPQRQVEPRSSVLLAFHRTGSHAHHLRDSAHAKPSASSFAAHATVIPSLGSPRSSFFLNCRWLLIQLPSFESSAHYLLRHVAVAVPAHVRLELDQLRLRSQPALSRCPSLRCLLLIMAADCSQAKPSASSFATRSAVIFCLRSPRSSIFLHCR